MAQVSLTSGVVLGSPEDIEHDERVLCDCTMSHSTSDLKTRNLLGGPDLIT